MIFINIKKKYCDHSFCHIAQPYFRPYTEDKELWDPGSCQPATFLVFDSAKMVLINKLWFAVCVYILWPLTSASKQCKHDNIEKFLCLYVSVLPSHALYQWSTTFLNLRSLTSVLVKGKIYLWKCWEKITWNAFHFSKCQENTVTTLSNRP